MGMDRRLVCPTQVTAGEVRDLEMLKLSSTHVLLFFLPIYRSKLYML